MRKAEMFGRFTAIIAAVVAIVLVSTAATQQSSSLPLGDVAREHRKARKQTENQSRTVTNEDIRAVATASDAKRAVPPPSSADGDSPKTDTSQSKKPEPKVEAKAEQPQDERSGVDGPKEPEAEGFVVPAGTQIKVDRGAGYVSVPVRVGWTTPIPALSKVTLEYVDGLFRLTSVTVHGTLYSVKAYLAPSMDSRELIFTLREPLVLR